MHAGLASQAYCFRCFEISDESGAALSGAMFAHLPESKDRLVRTTEANDASVGVIGHTVRRTQDRIQIQQEDRQTTCLPEARTGMVFVTVRMTGD